MTKLLIPAFMEAALIAAGVITGASKGASGLTNDGGNIVERDPEFKGPAPSQEPISLTLTDAEMTRVAAYLGRSSSTIPSAPPSANDPYSSPSSSSNSGDAVTPRPAFLRPGEAPGGYRVIPRPPSEFDTKPKRPNLESNQDAPPPSAPADLLAVDAPAADLLAEGERLLEGVRGFRLRSLDELERSLRINDELKEMWDVFRRDPVMQEIVEDHAAANEIQADPESFARGLLRSGWNASAIQTLRQKITERIGTSQEARATFQKILTKKGIPAIAGATATYILKKAWPATKETEGGIARVSPENIDKYIDEETGVVAPEKEAPVTPKYYSGVNSRGKSTMMFGEVKRIVADRTPKPIDGAASGTADPDQPFGPIDQTLPKSSPSVPPSSAATFTPRPAGTGIFTERLQGDALSERPNSNMARVRRTTIPAPPEQSYATPWQVRPSIDPSRAPERDQQPPSRTQTMKRKATEVPTHDDRNIENQIPQNYDPTFVPGMPSSVNANSSQQWKEYSAPYAGYNVPLTDAPNLVGIGFDAETTQRDMAETQIGGDWKENQQPRQAPQQTGTPTQPTTQYTGGAGQKEVNPANELNPANRNIGKERPAAQMAPSDVSPHKG